MFLSKSRGLVLRRYADVDQSVWDMTEFGGSRSAMFVEFHVLAVVVVDMVTVDRRVQGCFRGRIRRLGRYPSRHAVDSRFEYDRRHKP